MGYLEDLKKKAQNAYNAAQKAGQTASNVYNAAKQGVQNVYNAATGNTQNAAPQTQQVKNTQPSAATQPQAAQTTDWAAEYDKVMGSTPAGAVAQGTQGTPATQIQTSPAAQAALGSGAGGWQAELDNVMSQIMNQGKFEYNMNGDAMYQQYADIYQNQANLGMQNAMAQAAALTGGYGSSYGQMVGQQAYAQQMQGLNEIGLDLYDRAYAQDQAERERLNQQYAMLADREALEYNRAYQTERDAVSDQQWQQSFDYNKYLDELNQSNYEREFEYQQEQDKIAQSQWQDTFDYQKTQDALAQSNYEKELAYQQSRDEVADTQWQQSFDESKRQYESNLAYQQSRDEVTDAQWRAELDRMLANDQITQQQWQAEMDRLTANDAADNKYREDTLAYQKEQDKIAQSNFEKQFDYQKEQDAQTQQNWQAEMDRLTANDATANEQWQQSFDYNKYLDELEQSNYEKQFEYQKEQDKIAQSNWQAELDRLLANDAISQSQWQAEMDRALANDEISYQQWQSEMDRALANDKITQEQWQAEMDRALENDRISQEQWQASMDWQAEEFDKLYGAEGYYTKQDAIENQYRQDTFDYQKEQDKLAQSNYEKELAYQKEQDALDNAYRDAALREDQRQYDESLNWQKEEYDKLYGEDGYYTTEAQKDRDFQESMSQTEYDRLYGENGFYTKQNAADNKYRDEVFDYQKTQDEQAQKNWQAEFDREGKLQDLAIDQSKTTTKYEGEGDYNGKEVPKVLSGTQGLTTTNTNLFDDNGVFKNAAVVESSTSEAPEAGQGTMTYNIDGKTIKVQTGTSPYTKTVNPDAKKGVMANGYQPDNYGGIKVGEPLEGRYTTINGVDVDVYSVKKGGKDIILAYDAANNKYIEIPTEEIEEGEPINPAPLTGGGKTGGYTTSHLNNI